MSDPVEADLPVHEWDEAIARHDIIVVSLDLLWRVEVMNAIAVRGEADVDDAAKLLEAAASLDPAWPSVVVVGPTGIDDATRELDEFRSTHARARILVAYDDPTDATLTKVTAAGFDDVVDARSGIPAIVDAALLSLAEARSTATPAADDESAEGAGGMETASPPDADEAVELERVTGRLIIVTSAKGGQGVTTVAVNLAAAIAQHDGTSVMLVEGDPAFGDISLHLGLPVAATDDEPELLAQHPERLDLYTHHHKPTGLDVVVPPRSSDPLRPLPIETLLTVLTEALLRADVVVLDAPLALVVSAGIGPDAAELLIVSASGVAELKNALIAGEILRPSGSVGLVLNRAHHAPKSQEVEDAVELPILAKLADDDIVRRHPVGAEPIVGTVPKRPFSKHIVELADRVLGTL